MPLPFPLPARRRSLGRFTLHLPGAYREIPAAARWQRGHRPLPDGRAPSRPARGSRGGPARSSSVRRASSTGSPVRASDRAGQFTRGQGARPFVAFKGEGEADHEADGMVRVAEFEERRAWGTVCRDGGPGCRGVTRASGFHRKGRGPSGPRPSRWPDSARGRYGHGRRAMTQSGRPETVAPTGPSWRRIPCCSWCASSARAGTRAPPPAACRRGSCAAGRPG